MIRRFLEWLWNLPAERARELRVDILIMLRAQPDLTAAELCRAHAVAPYRMYPALLDLEKQGKIESRWIEGPHPRRRVYRRKEWRSLSNLLRQFGCPEGYDLMRDPEATVAAQRAFVDSDPHGENQAMFYGWWHQGDYYEFSTYSGRLSQRVGGWGKPVVIYQHIKPNV